MSLPNARFLRLALLPNHADGTSGGYADRAHDRWLGLYGFHEAPAGQSDQSQEQDITDDQLKAVEHGSRL